MSKRLLVPFFFLLPALVHATHLRGGQIRVVSANGLTCKIELRLLTNTASLIMAGEGILDFGDGGTYATPTKENTILNEQPNLGVVVYTIDHTYAGPGRYVLSYQEPNLTAGILNMTRSEETRFYIESVINIDPFIPSFVSPNFQTDPIFLLPLRQVYQFSTAAIPDSASNDFYYKYYVVTDPPGVKDYEVPGNLAVNEDNGIVTWDTRFHDQYLAGLFWIEVRIEKYSKAGYFCGYVIRAIQLTVEDGDSRLDLSSSADPNGRVVVTDGKEKKIKLVLTDDKTVDSVYFDIYYNKTISKNISFHQYDSTTQDRKFKIGSLVLKTSSEISSELPYVVSLRGHASYIRDVAFLYMTQDVDLPKVPEIVTGFSEKKQLKVYPNPFRAEIYIDGETLSDATFINSLGQSVMRSSLEPGQPVNTASLPAGFYVLQVNDKNGGKTWFKVVRN